MRRRDFVQALAVVATACPLTAHAQRSMPVIGYLSSRGADDPYMLAPMRQGFKEAGFVEGQDVAIEYRFAENQDERLPALAADLVRRRVAVIIAAPTVPALAAKAATSTIPIAVARKRAARSDVKRPARRAVRLCSRCDPVGRTAIKRPATPMRALHRLRQQGRNDPASGLGRQQRRLLAVPYPDAVSSISGWDSNWPMFLQ
jgi:hypothetical protein